MPDQKYSRDTQRLDFIGIDLNRPVDSVKPGKLPFGKNIRSFLAGRIEPRDGMTFIANPAPGQTPVHSARRLNDPVNNTFTRVVGVGPDLTLGQTAFTTVDTGYSEQPLSLVPYRPEDSPLPFMYVADLNKMRKVNTQASVDSIGYAAPLPETSVALTNSPKYNVIDDCQALTGWSAGGDAIDLVLASNTGSGGAGYRTNTTINAILYDVGSTGWACVSPVSVVGIAAGQRIIVNGGGGTAETTVVQVFTPGSAATEIANIIYDSGSTGFCSIYLSTPVDLTGLVDAFLLNTSRTQAVRIVAIASGPDGTTSIRVNTSSTTWAAGDTVELIPSFRCYLNNTHSAAETLVDDALSFEVGSGNASAPGVGYITKTVSLNLSQIANGVATQPDDLMYISVWMQRPEAITEVKVLLDVDATTNDFTHNYYYRALRPSDLTLAAENIQTTLTARSTAIQNNVIAAPIQAPSTSQGGSGSSSTVAAAIQAASAIIKIAQQAAGHPSGQNGTIIQNLATTAAINAGINVGVSAAGGISGILGDIGTALAFLGQVTTAPIDNNFVSQQLEGGTLVYVPIAFPISQLGRYGTDDSRTLQDVAAIRIQVTSGVVGRFQVDNWFIGGGYGPSTFDATTIPYLYRYRVRNPTTNVRSNPSPASRYPVSPLRQSVTVTMPQYTALPGDLTVSPNNLVVDLERFGGAIAEWHYIATINNIGTPTFVDTIRDDLVAGNPIGDISDYQPWPIIGVPVVGTTGNVAGTSVTDSGNNFNLNWAPGTRILINNVPYTIYRVNSTSFLEIVENADSQLGVPWRINEPTILAQPLQILWYQDNYNCFFACGDPMNAGRLYWSNPNAETTTPANYIDVSSPSDPVMNGVAYNTRSYLFTSSNMFQILNTSSFEAIAQNSALAQSPIGFEAQRINGGKGLFSPWAITREPAPVICFLSKDGIYMTNGGGAPTPLTDADLYELFPNEGNPGVIVNGVGSPQITQSQRTNLRLAYYDEYLYFDYVDQNSIQSTLALAFDLGATTRGEAPGGWLFDIYSPPVTFHYGEEGAEVHSLLLGTTGQGLYQYAGFTDGNGPIVMSFTTPSRDQGDPRSNKYYGDIMLDSNTQGVNATCTPFINNNLTSLPSTIVNNLAGRSQTAIPLATNWQTALNISLFVTCSVNTSNRPFFYIWEPRWTFESAPISALSWNISPTTFGMDGYKHFGLIKMAYVSTTTLNLTFTVDGVAQSPISVPSSGGIYVENFFRVPVMKGLLWQVRVDSSDGVTPFRLDTRDSYFEVKDWGVDDAYAKLRIFSDFADIRG